MKSYAVDIYALLDPHKATVQNLGNWCTSGDAGPNAWWQERTSSESNVRAAGETNEMHQETAKHAE